MPTNKDVYTDAMYCYHREKLQTRPLGREDAQHRQSLKCLKVKNVVLGPRWGLTQRLTGQLTFDRNVKF